MQATYQGVIGGSRLVLFILTAMIGMISCHERVSARRSDALEFVILVTSTSSYCGGARPPEEMLQELRTPRKLAGREVVIRRGNVNRVEEEIVWSGKSDENGELHVALTPGEYCLSGIEKRSRAYVDSLIMVHKNPVTNYDPIDVGCIEKWIERPETVFKVDLNGSHLFEVNFHIPCSWNATPCVNYNGPKPG